MTTTSYNNGRLCNQIFRNIAVSIIAEKHNLHVNYANYDLISNELGIRLFSGSNIYSTFNQLNDTNYFDIFNLDNIDYNLDANNNFFQTNDISNLIFDYINKNKNNIIEKNQYKSHYNNNNDIFIHIRLTDVSHYNPGINYFLNTIKQINHDKIYIASDDCNHDIVKTLIINYPDIIIIDYNEINTIHFGSTCKNVILSHDSFSCIIGYLSFYSNIYYAEYNLMWYDDIFSNKNWIKINTHLE